MEYFIIITAILLFKDIKLRKPENTNIFMPSAMKVPLIVTLTNYQLYKKLSCTHSKEFSIKGWTYDSNFIYRRLSVSIVTCLFFRFGWIFWFFV